MDENKSSAGGFLKQGSILAAASILVRVIGMFYRIPLANIIGDEGNGIYSAAFEVYNILLILSAYGMPMAVSKMVSAKCTKKEYRGAYRIFRYSMIFSFVSGGLMALFVFFGANWIEANFFSSFHGIAIPLRILAPTIFVVAVMGTLRGLFQGKNTMLPTAVSQILEQIVNAVVSIVAAYYLMQDHSASKKLSAWGAAGGTMGTFMGALTAFGFLLFIYVFYLPVLKKQARRDKVTRPESIGDSYRLIFWTVIPIILSQTVYQLSGIVDVTIFNYAMGMRGVKGTVISTLQGIYSTKYRLLVSVPIAVSTAIASSMIPSLVASFTRKDGRAVKEKITMAIKFNMIIAFPSAVGLAVLAQPIIRLLFPASDYITGGMMLMTGSTCIIFYALSTVTSGVLQSIDKMNLPVIHSLISLVIHIVAVFLLLRYTGLGAYALVFGNVTYPLVVCILNGHSVRKHLGFKQEMVKTFCVPFLSSVTMGVFTFVVYQMFFLVSHRIYIAIIPAFIVAVASYFVFVLKLQGLTRRELCEFPMGRRMSVVADRFHLLKD
ncbi:MAG: polysaccharide biosynthesis protein [Lachnospiraceae bacterium]|nr:polysaccharide biosynthesis protein [Lachnospiraceae bacterium]